MLQGIIIRGTTPKHDFEIPYQENNVKDIRVSYVQNNKVVLTKNKTHCVFFEKGISIQLTQEDTISFSPTKNVFVEIRIQLVDGNVVMNEEAMELRIVDSANVEVLK